MPECKDKNASCGFHCTGYDGKKVWEKLHALPKEIDCEECSSHADNLFKGLHDAVNVGLGKVPHNIKNFETFAKEVSCSYNRCLEKGWCGKHEL